MNELSKEPQGNKANTLLCGVCNSKLQFIGSPEDNINEWKFINNKFVPDDLYECKKCGKLWYLSELNAT